MQLACAVSALLSGFPQEKQRPGHVFTVLWSLLQGQLSGICCSFSPGHLLETVLFPSQVSSVPVAERAAADTPVNSLRLVGQKFC